MANNSDISNVGTSFCQLCLETQQVEDNVVCMANNSDISYVGTSFCQLCLETQQVMIVQLTLMAIT
jgi:ferredoxin-thioredoxin reductase catalytic subunit